MVLLLLQLVVVVVTAGASASSEALVTPRRDSARLSTFDRGRRASHVWSSVGCM
jgi:hypothetical protein